MGSSHSYLINLDAVVVAPVATPISTVTAPIHWINGEECFELDVPEGKIQTALLAKGVAGACTDIGFTVGEFTQTVNIPSEGNVTFKVSSRFNIEIAPQDTDLRAHVNGDMYSAYQ